MADEITGLGYETDEASVPSLGNLLTSLETEEKKRSSRIVKLGELGAAGGYLSVDKKDVFPIDERAKRAMGSFLNIPVPYLTRISTGLAEDNISWHFQQSPENTVELVSDEFGALIEARNPNSMAVTPVQVARILNKVMGAETLVNRVAYNLNNTTIDLSNSSVQIAPAHRVGDITFGGLRVLMPRKDYAPEVGTYLHRLICTNGAYSIVNGDVFSIKGMTHEDILKQLESTASMVWNRLPNMLQAYAALDDKEVADPIRMVQVYGAEHGISPRYINQATKLVSDERAANPSRVWTLYDIMQVFTSLTHLDTVKENTRNKLMALGGALVSASAHERRCAACSHLLTEGGSDDFDSGNPAHTH